MDWKEYLMIILSGLLIGVIVWAGSELQSARSTLEKVEATLLKVPKPIEDEETLRKEIKRLKKRFNNFRRKSISGQVTGIASREDPEKPRGDTNLVWVNPASRAHCFALREKVDVTILSTSKKAQASVGGVIFDNQEYRILQMNHSLAEELGFSYEQGIAEVSIKRTDSQVELRLHKMEQKGE